MIDFHQQYKEKNNNPLFQLTALELHYVSPKLLMCHDLELAVPGSYDANKPIVRIAKVESALQVRFPMPALFFTRFWREKT